MNELIFIAHTLFIMLSALSALRMGKLALTGFICIQTLLVNLFVTKQAMLFGLMSTSAEPFAVGITLSFNLLQEYYGKDVTRKALWASFYTVIFALLVSQIHLAYIAVNPAMHNHFVALFGFMPRIICASLVTYFTVEQLNRYLYAFLIKFFGAQKLMLRNYLSIGIAQLIDTIMFSFLGLYGIVENIWEVIVVSYAVKWVAISLSGPFLLLCKKVHATKTHT